MQTNGTIIEQTLDVENNRNGLTNRELQVAKLLAMGNKNSDIAAELQISVKTVDTHRGHVLKKLNLRNNVDLARHAILVGMVAAPGQV